ncbi:MAG: hypothetical protein PWR10_1723 [Halanaerobiales bacterium]|nr:hypothetical protein [Halanaerobiales bacterium]
MKLLILGGGSCQLNAIRRAKEKGHTVIVSDYYPDAPGKELSDFGELTSTFDVEGNIEVAKKYAVDGVMTTGTDQPVYTAAKVAAELGLPSLIDLTTAKAVTNKRIMKNRFKAEGIPTVNFRFLKKDFSDSKLDGMNFPVVVKPLDSQGQRGVYRLGSIREIREHFTDVLSFSREEEILVEEYYESDEITVSGWVKEGRVYLLTVTDRVTFENGPHIGICSAHNFPSRYLKRYFQEIREISAKIVKGFNIRNGPIYIQMLVGDEGIRINEVACRIGGAYEDVFIPHLTGVDILEMMIDAALGLEIDPAPLKEYDLTNNNKWFSAQLFFAWPGKIKRLTDLNSLKRLPGVIEAGFNFKIGDEIGEIKNATQRAGYILVGGKDREHLAKNLNRVFARLKIFDEEGNNLVIRKTGTKSPVIYSRCSS